MTDKMRERTILDDGIHARQKVFVQINGIHGEILGADFERSTVQVEINVPAHLVSDATVGHLSEDIFISE